MLNFQTWERVCKVFIFMSYSGDPPSLPPNCHVLDLLVSKICHRKDQRWRPWGSRVTSLSVVIFSGVKIPPKSWTAQAASLWGLCSKTSGIRFRHVCKTRNKSKELRLLPFCEENKKFFSHNQKSRPDIWPQAKDFFYFFGAIVYYIGNEDFFSSKF